MPRKITLVISAMLFALPNFSYSIGRSEVSRYYLLRDRVLVERELRQYGGHFFNIDLIISSGVKDLIGDVDTATAQGSSTDRTIAINKLLLKNANTERFIDADISAAIPLPYIKIGKTRILPNLFFGFNLGASTSVASPTGDPNDVELQAYAKKETRMGLRTLIRFKPKETWDISISKLNRADLFERRDAVTIASSGDVINLDGINQDEASWRLALGFVKENVRDLWFVRVSDIKLASAPGHEKDAIYDHTPLWHAGFSRRFYMKWGELRPLVGIHMRERYGIDDGIYLALKGIVDSEFPMSLEARLDNAFFTLTPAFEGRYFALRYGIRTPYRNPQSDLWVSSMHQISLTFPFP